MGMLCVYSGRDMYGEPCVVCAALPCPALDMLSQREVAAVCSVVAVQSPNMLCHDVF